MKTEKILEEVIDKHWQRIDSGQARGVQEVPCDAIKEINEIIQHLTDFGYKKKYNDLIKRAIAELTHSRVFISSRQKMHPDGIKLYDEFLDELKTER